MLPSCREIAELVSENIDKPLKGRRWLKMKLHLMMCTFCRQYKKQMEITQKTVCQLDCQQAEDSKEQIFKKVEANYKETHMTK